MIDLPIDARNTVTESVWLSSLQDSHNHNHQAKAIDNPFNKMAESSARSTPQPSQASQQPQQTLQQQQAGTQSIIAALSNALQSSTGEKVHHDRIAELLNANMDQLNELAKQGRLSQAQISQVDSSVDCRASLADTDLCFSSRPSRQLPTHKQQQLPPTRQLPIRMK